MVLRSSRQLACAAATVASLCVSSPSAAQAGTSASQRTYTVLDLGPGNPPSAYPPQYVCGNPSGSPSCHVWSNATGQVAFSPYILGTGVDAYFWEPGLTQPIFIGANLLDQSRAGAISSNGFVVGITDSGFTRGFRWSRATGTSPLGGNVDYSYPLAVNASGVVVGQDVEAGSYRAVMWDNQYEPIHLDDLAIEGENRWVFESAQSISNDGVITGVGRYVTDAGATETHHFALIPAPGSGGALDRSDWTVRATESAPQDPPGNAIDGNIATRFSTGNAQHDSQGFIVSWPGDRTISRIRMDVGPSTNDYPRTCGIWIKDTAGTVTFVNCTPDANGNVDVSFTPIAASTIEVWQWGSSPQWWSIAEFNAFNQ
jgi:hypothetical protein